MENRWQDLRILWSDGDKLVGRPNPNRLSRKRVPVPLTRFFAEYMGRARSLERMGQAPWSKWAVE